MEYYAGNDDWIMAAAFKLRYDVFVLEQGISPSDEFDDTPRKHYGYLLLMEENLPVATIRYQSMDAVTINPDRFCVAQAFRGQGYGKTLLAYYEEKAKQDGYQQAMLSAEIEAVGFYKKNGYQVDSPPFCEDGITCVIMTKTLV